MVMMNDDVITLYWMKIEAMKILGVLYSANNFLYKVKYSSSYLLLKIHIPKWWKLYMHVLKLNMSWVVLVVVVGRECTNIPD